MTAPQITKNNSYKGCIVDFFIRKKTTFTLCLDLLNNSGLVLSFNSELPDFSGKAVR